MHKQEIIALLNLLPGLIRAFEPIYMTVAPPLTRAVAGIASAFAAVVNALDKLGPGSRAILGLTLISAKLGVLVPALKGLAGLTGLDKVLAKIPGLGGLAGGGGIMGIRGPVAPGSAANPIAVTGLGGGGGALSTAENDALKGAGAADTSLSAAGVAKLLATPAVSAAVLSAAAVGADYGLHKLFPSVFPEPHFSTQPVGYGNFDPLSAFQNFGPNAPLRRVNSNFGRTQLGAVGGPTSGQAPAPPRDFSAFIQALANLEQHKAGIAQTAAALDQLAAKAAKLGDVPYNLAGRLGAELLKTRNVASAGVQTLLREFDRLPPGVHVRAEAAMVQMATTLKTVGVLSQRQVADLLGSMLSITQSEMAEIKKTVGSNLGKAAEVGSAAMSTLATNVYTAMQAGDLTTGQAMQIIVRETQKVLDQFGGAKLTVPQVEGLAALELNVTQYVASKGGMNGAAGLGGAATGGRIDRPMMIVGEEAPAFHEFVIAVNPAYRERNLGLWAQAGHDLGIPGFAHGGITAPKVTGAGGLAGAVRGAANFATKAANAFISSHMPALGAGHGGGVSAAGLSGGLVSIVDQISRQKGWNPADWLGVISLESGGSMTATNPSSGAYGIAQFIQGAGEYYQWGGNPNTLSGQLVAMANYIASRYGSPTAALAHEHALHWYRKGGVIGRRHHRHHHSSGGAGLPSRTRSHHALSPAALDASAGGIDSAVGLLGLIEDLPPGTSLTALGISPAILAALGLGRSHTQRLVGTGLSYFQNLAASGQTLTPAQLGQAKTGVHALNALLTKEETPLEKELRYWQHRLPHLHGHKRTDALSKIGTLAQSLINLQATIAQNNDGLSQLTDATNSNTRATSANTQATATMTGSVAFTYQGQTYLGSLSSDKRHVAWDWWLNDGEAEPG